MDLPWEPSILSCLTWPHLCIVETIAPISSLLRAPECCKMCSCPEILMLIPSGFLVPQSPRAYAAIPTTPPRFLRSWQLNREAASMPQFLWPSGKWQYNKNLLINLFNIITSVCYMITCIMPVRTKAFISWILSAFCMQVKSVCRSGSNS